MSSRACTHCGCNLSRYNDTPLCSACTAIKPPSYDDYFASVADTTEGKLRGADTCRNGHDLTIHGKVIQTGGGRSTRRCMTCRREREKQYQRDRRARLKQAAA